MHHVVTLIRDGKNTRARRVYSKPGTNGTGIPDTRRGRGKTVYILPYSDTTLALLLVGFTEYDDDDKIKDSIARCKI
ncbi:hypothetical protein Hanom_Chr00s005633g01729561 [Helianthus anomalus]